MKPYDVSRGRTLRIAVGITMLALLLAGGASAGTQDNSGADTILISGATTRTLTVNAAGGADYTKIQEAIDNAGDGDTILVSGGTTTTLTYFENVNVDKQLVLQGIDEGAGQPVVDAGGSGDTITLSSDGVTLTGFKVINSGSLEGEAGIKVTSNYNLINDNIASNNPLGIYLYFSTNNILSSNEASNNILGILLNSSQHNTLTDNIANYNNYEGFFLKYSDDNILTRNTANYNNFYSIYLYYSRGNSLSNNNVLNNYDGIVLQSSDYNDLIDNSANFNNYYGISLYRSNYNLLNRNTANSNNYGIRAEFSNYNTLSKNTVNLSNLYGISMDVDNTIYNNYFYNNNNFQNIGGYSNIWNITKTTGNNIIGGPYLGGNYWANPDGTGFSQTCTDNDGDGICDSPYVLDSNNIDYLPLTNNGLDNPPVANAGPDQVANAGDTVHFDGSGSTDDMGIYSYEWDFTSDGIFDVFGITASHIYDTPGNYAVTLRVTDTAGQTDIDTANITMIDPVPPPAVHDVAIYSLSGPASVTKGENAVYRIDIKNEGNIPENVTYSIFDTTDNVLLPGCKNTHYGLNPGSIMTTWCTLYTSNSSAGTHIILGHVESVPGEIDLADNNKTVSTMIVAPPDAPPVANAGPDQLVYTGDPVYLDGSGSTDDNGILLYEWDFDSDGTYDASGVTASHIYSAAGTYAVTLRVTDTVNQVDTDTAIITVTEPDSPPVTNAGPDQSVLTGETVNLDGSGSTDDNGIVLYEWDFESDGTYDATGVTASHIYSAAGTYTVTLRVTDTVNQVDTDTAIITVTEPDSPPVANAGPDQSVLTGEPVNLDGSGSTDDNGIVLYEWDFESDGTYDATGVTVSHIYSTAGTYTVTLQVTDTAGQKDTDIAIITVTEPPLLDITNLVTDRTSYSVGELVTAMATVKNNFASTVNNVFVDFVYKDQSGTTVHTDTQKIRRLFAGESNDAVSTYTLDPNAQTGTYTVEASVRWDIQTYDTEQTTFEVTGSIPSNEIMHVEEIAFSTNQKSKTETLETRITILDDSLSLVDGATVNGILTLPDLTTLAYSGITLVDGTVTFEYSEKNQPLPAGTYVFTVTGVAKSGATYDPAQNKETSDSFTK